MNKNSHNMNQTQVSTTPTSQRKITGLWGGQGISMEVTDSGASLDFDCASGTITEQIIPDGAGKFSAKGRFARHRPGPTREGEDTEGQPAIYNGVLDGENLTLTITLAHNSEKVGNFMLVHGKAGRIRRCGWAARSYKPFSETTTVADKNIGTRLLSMHDQLFLDHDAASWPNCGSWIGGIAGSHLIVEDNHSGGLVPDLEAESINSKEQ
jgi:hypothetical protein